MFLVTTVTRRCLPGVRVCTAFSTLQRVNNLPSRSSRARQPIIHHHHHHHRVQFFFSSSSSLSSSVSSQGGGGGGASTDIEISPANHDTVPLQDWYSTTSPLDPRLIKALQSQGIVTPTPIQAHGIPLLQKGYDVMASSRTGSGKTLLFALPICERLLRMEDTTRTKSAAASTKRGGPIALILNPTRELAQQTAATIEELISHVMTNGGNNNSSSKHPRRRRTNIKVALATGGASVKQQRQHIQQCDILVATPGRLLQFLDERSISLNSIQDVVCDESDRMVDLGFEPQLRRIAQNLKRSSSRENNNRRTVLCSATFPQEVQRVAADFLKSDYYFIAIGKVGATHTGITQKLLWVEGGPTQKRNQAIREIQTFLDDNNRQKKQQQQQSQIIVFCNTKDEAETIGKAIQQRIRGRLSVRVVTGDRSQEQRNRFLDAFRQGKVDVLVATDVAARGLDVRTIGMVLQVDTPRDVDTFVHRVGRTGRAGAKGRAVALLDGRSIGVASSLVELLQEAQQPVPAWLLGMSYVSRARALEEEGAIAAGGGGTLTSGGTSGSSENQSSTTTTTTSDDSFSHQDFRNTAAAGSWGAERDTSYQDFDADAYSSLDAGSVSLDSLDDDDDDDDTVLADEDTDAISFDDGEEEVQGDQTTISLHSTPFERQQPTRKLCETLRRISGTEEMGDSADAHVLSKLSQRGADQRLWFEYLGMFPFEAVSHVLMKREKHDDLADRDGNVLPRVLMVAEKPSIAKAIADALSGPRGPRQKRGISRALPVYEFTSNQFAPIQNNESTKKSVSCKVIVTSVVGHVFSLGFDQQENQGSKDPAEFFRIPVVKQEEGSSGKLRVVEHLRALAGECDHLVLWLDCDAEGENIAHEVMGVTRRAIEQKIVQEMRANPDATPQRRVHRARFSAITNLALRDAFSNLVEPDAVLSQSVDARQELDLRVGVALTRLLTWRCVRFARQNFSATTKFISYGPCQTPALSFCVSRATEIEAFNPREYWKVDISARSQDGEGDGLLKLRWLPPPGSSVTNNRGGGRRIDKASNEKFEESASFDKMAAQDIAKQASKPNAYTTVAKVENISEKVNAPLALNTVALLAAGSKAMGMSPKKVMQVAERLYSSGLLSYPRTETTRYDPTGFDVRSVLREHTSHPQWGPTANYLLRTKYANSGKPPLRGKDAGDHPPITCLKPATREELGGGAEWRVYEFVCRTFLGSLSDELMYTRQVAQLKMGDDRFELEQIQVESLGFAGACPWVLRDIGAESRGKHGEKRNPLHLREGMKLPISKARVERCLTRPPPFLQEHELIERMDTNRIGTDASMATHVNNIVERGYVVLCDETGVELRPPRPPRPGQKPLPRQIGRYMVPTSLGMSLIDLFKEEDEGHGSLDDEAKDDSPSLLARPAIRAQMEEEVKQIALGTLEKKECVDKNLAWFQARYNELTESLSKQRINEFGRSLSPTRESLKHWRKLGAFEEPASTGAQDSGHPKRRKSTRNATTKRQPRGRSGGSGRARQLIKKSKKLSRPKQKGRGSI